ncbi:unnamed protein product [Schistocephalus solidus]|uniref:ubiquitinyl hydrolase 1 n=1 Tax=Schistocephalus solidus TaxID=70667 RepID=A0A183T237_SCHSO|nr:unnamed protein product [Schistocephalus solidus]
MSPSKRKGRKPTSVAAQSANLEGLTLKTPEGTEPKDVNDVVADSVPSPNTRNKKKKNRKKGKSLPATQQTDSDLHSNQTIDGERLERAIRDVIEQFIAEFGDTSRPDVVGSHMPQCSCPGYRLQLRGFVNQKNNCYLISCLRVLFSIKAFVGLLDRVSQCAHLVFQQQQGCLRARWTSSLAPGVQLLRLMVLLLDEIAPFRSKSLEGGDCLPRDLGLVASGQSIKLDPDLANVLCFEEEFQQDASEPAFGGTPCQPFLLHGRFLSLLCRFPVDYQPHQYTSSRLIAPINVNADITANDLSAIEGVDREDTSRAYHFIEIPKVSIQDCMSRILTQLHEEMIALRRKYNPPEPVVIPPEFPEVEDEDDEGWTTVGTRGKKFTEARQVHADSGDSSPISLLFGGLLLSSSSYKKESRTADKSSINLKERFFVQRLEDSFALLSRGETLSDFRDPDKGDCVVMSRRVCLDHLPPVLLLQLNRFYYASSSNANGQTEFGIQKIPKRIPIYQNLQITEGNALPCPFIWTVLLFKPGVIILIR